MQHRCLKVSRRLWTLPRVSWIMFSHENLYWQVFHIILNIVKWLFLYTQFAAWYYQTALCRSPRTTTVSLPWGMCPEWTSIRLNTARTIVGQPVLWHSWRALHATTSQTRCRHLLPVGHFSCIVQLNVTLAKHLSRIQPHYSILTVKLINLTSVNSQH
jgi:hypothetical protein